MASELASHQLSDKCIRIIATIDIKKGEDGLLQYASENNLEIEYHTNHDLKKTNFPSEPSAAALKYTGTPSVCEGAAILSSRASNLVVNKNSHGKSITVAIARMKNTEPDKKGKLYLVGTGPGSPEHLTYKARKAIDNCEVIVGYRSYISQIEDIIGKQEVIATGMGEEVKRVQAAVESAASGRNVCLISGGDTGIYGMASLVGEIVDSHREYDMDIEVIPGITALVAGAARLGSPISVDFAAISLSDYLVPLDKIYDRIELAAKGDFVISLYNPKSKKRADYLAEARNIIMKYRAASTPVGYITNAFRKDEKTVITDLEHILEHDVDMNTIVIIGNSTTFVSGNWIITPRGYQNKYKI